MVGGRGSTITTIAEKIPVDIAPNSEEEFITEHFWGYTKISDTVTSEYEVAHPRWQIYPVINYDVNVDFKKVYGNNFAFLQEQEPVSVYLAEGSEIIVKAGSKIRFKK
jgi:hypothetical protein